LEGLEQVVTDVVLVLEVVPPPPPPPPLAPPAPPPPPPSAALPSVHVPGHAISSVLAVPK
jgi:hypothetical protein